MRHIVVGASGQVGSHLLRCLGAIGEQAVGTYYSRPAPGLIYLDLAGDEAALAAAVAGTEWVWIPAAMPDVDRCEREPAWSWQVNVKGPLKLARAAAQAGARTVFFSSDYVFDGIGGPFAEGDRPRPLQTYGRHKLEAEQALLADVPEALVVRTAWVYSKERHPRNFVHRVVEALAAGQRVPAAEDQWNTPTDAEALVSAAWEAARAGLSGVLHLAGPERLTRYEFTCRIAEAAGYPRDRVEPVALGSLSLPAARPLDGGLKSTRWAPVGAPFGGGT
ncbi:MAG: SDR family oxidoreductase [Firmicutes bacterium]|nr:SDR family oxidoreductase [Alicyclobacillaceae bacterium]MCL6498067.1 SDR family oxidoreductase [Bacillota bacterium]